MQLVTNQYLQFFSSISHDWSFLTIREPIDFMLFAARNRGT